jgi:hypothetical protein
VIGRDPRTISLFAAALGLWVSLSPEQAGAQPADDPCLTAPVDGQKLRRDGNLLDARDKFDLCGRKTCPDTIIQACMRWGSEVQSAIPSVVVVARDAAGGDVTDAQVSVDGQPPAPIMARALELNPGTHRFVFKRPGSPDVERQALVHEGEKNREVLVTFGAVAQPPARPPEPARPVSTLTWVLGGLGGVALIGSGTFGAMGLSARSSNHCDTGCTQPQYNDALTKLQVADVLLGVGVVALGAATWLYLTRPTEEPQAASRLDVPFDVRFTQGGGVGVVTGRF